MQTVNKSKKSGYLFIASGVAFFAAAILGEQLSFYGIGLMFVILGSAFIHKASEE
ncbi:hypothetical protein [Neptunicella sp.]|uniref:hypothetical protein n=1 Tax=Neptunicella sp. TaxID=2125986 RepID=UPI003F68C999